MSEDNGKKTRERGKIGKYVLRAAVCIGFALLFFLMGWFGRYLALGERERSLLWAIGTAEQNFYRPVDEDTLYRDLFSAFALDDYSQYYTREQYAAVERANEGAGTGVGISVTTAEGGGKLRLFRVTGGSPAEKAGLASGMYLFRYGADETSLTEGTSAALTAFIGERGESEPIVLEAGFDAEGKDAALYTMTKGSGYVRSECLYRDNERSLRFDPGHGYAETPTWHGGIADLPSDMAYLRIDAFYGRAAEETAHALAYMKESGRTRLILDLRSNGGGYLSVFQGIASHLLRDAKGSKPLVATARFRSGKVTNYNAPANDFSRYFGEGAEIYLLADENTASASECLIGALVSYGTVDYGGIFLREQKDGTAKTYGKGIMQSHYTDPNGNVLKLTSAEVFWPNGRSIHGTGVTKADGAVGIPAPLLAGKEDVFLQQVLQRIAS